MRARIDSSRANSEAALKKRKANVVVKNLIPMFDELALTSIRRNPQKTRAFSIKNRDKPLNWFPLPGKFFLGLLRINQEKPNFALRSGIFPAIKLCRATLPRTNGYLRSRTLGRRIDPSR